MWYVDAATNVLQDFNISATMARQGGQVQLEQSDMGLALIMAKMAKAGFSCAAMEKTRYQIITPCAAVWEEMKRAVEFPGQKNGKAAMEWHPAMLRENQTDGCLPFHTGTAQNPQTPWRHKGTRAPPQVLVRQPTPEPMRHLPGIPPVSPAHNEGAHTSEIEALPPWYVYIHTSFPSAQFFNLDAYAKDPKHNKDINPDLLTDKGTSTG